MTANSTLKETRKQMFAEFEHKLPSQRPPEDGIFYLHPDEEHLVLSHALCHLITRTAAKQHSRLKSLLLLRQYQEEMLEAWLTESPDFPDLLRYRNLMFEGLMYELKVSRQLGLLTPSQANQLGSTLAVAAGYGGDMPDEKAWELLDNMNFEQNKVRCRKMEQMLPWLKKWVEEEMQMK